LTIAQRIAWTAGVPVFLPRQWDDFIAFRGGLLRGVVDTAVGSITGIIGLATALVAGESRALRSLSHGDWSAFAATQFGYDLLRDAPSVWGQLTALPGALWGALRTMAVGDPAESGHVVGSLVFEVALCAVPAAGASARAAARAAIVTRRASRMERYVIVGESEGVTDLGAGGVWEAVSRQFREVRAARTVATRLENVDGLVVMSGAHGALAVRASRVLRSPGYYDVFVHGTPEYFVVERAFLRESGEFGTHTVRIGPRDLARFIRSQPDYVPGMPVRLLACEAGEGRLAQQLADKLGTEIVASDRVVTIGSDGMLGSELGDGRMLRFRPAGRAGAPAPEVVHPLPRLPESARWKWEADPEWGDPPFRWTEGGRVPGRVTVRLANTHELPSD